MSSNRALGVVAATGLVATIVISLLVGMTASSSLSVASWSVAAALLAGAVGAGAMRAARSRSVSVQATLVALTVVVAVVAGVLVASWHMAIASHDLHALVVIVMAAGTIGVLAAMVLGGRVLAGSRSLGLVARRIGEGSMPLDTQHAVHPGELADVAAELELMARRLADARAAELAMEASRRELVAWVSHDLRTPLAGIRAIAEALEDKVVDDPEGVARYHRTLRVEADRLSELVDDLFELSRIQAGALRLQMERASLSDLVSDAIAAADPVAVAKGVRLEGQLRGEPPELVLSTPEVSRVLRNLLENAIRHTPSDGTVSIEAGIDDDVAYVCVADACGGIVPEELDRVFDLAYRGEAARTPEEDSRGGLGLAIARGLVEAHAGEIEVCNDGPGCRFTVRLPLPAS